MPGSSAETETQLQHPLRDKMAKMRSRVSSPKALKTSANLSRVTVNFITISLIVIFKFINIISQPQQFVKGFHVIFIFFAVFMNSFCIEFPDDEN
jgi:hypothetical protein